MHVQRTVRQSSMVHHVVDHHRSEKYLKMKGHAAAALITHHRLSDQLVRYVLLIMEDWRVQTFFFHIAPHVQKRIPAIQIILSNCAAWPTKQIKEAAKMLTPKLVCVPGRGSFGRKVAFQISGKSF